VIFLVFLSNQRIYFLIHISFQKAVEIIELICSDAAARPRTEATERACPRGGTLVVLPVSLLSQWNEEMRTKAPHLTTEIYNGDIAKAYERHGRRDAKTPAGLASYDVVLTTMGKLRELTQRRVAGTMNVLDKISWHRLVVDECQYLKNDTTAIAKSASAIDSRHVWMMSGTPLTNKLDDLRGELSLVRTVLKSGMLYFITFQTKILNSPSYASGPSRWVPRRTLNG